MPVSFSQFDPSEIPWQDDALDKILCGFDYTKGTHEVLFSGSVGSAKSTLAAHLIVLHCLRYKNAQVIICRKTLPNLKKTLFKEVLNHLAEKQFVEGKHYSVRGNSAEILFKNGSHIHPGYWRDKQYKKFRSMSPTLVVIEELSENNEEDKEAYDELMLRLGRVPGVPSLMLCLTNPDEPSHWVYKHFIQSSNDLVHVFYSLTEDNKFLPQSYIEKLRSELDPMMARRMLKGEWLSIRQKSLYYAYTDKNFVKNKYQIDPRYPIGLSWDFNIGANKPLSCIAFQYIQDTFHFFAEVVLDTARTKDSLDELHNKGLISSQYTYLICGDATGRHKDTRSNVSDWDIILKYFSNMPGVSFRDCVPKSNPGIRDRHNKTNAYCENDLGQVRIKIYESCPTADQGMRLTALKKGADYIEDDSKPYQHITTAIGYAVCELGATKQKTMISLGGR